MTTESIRKKYTARQYFNKLVREGEDPVLASAKVNAIYNTTKGEA